jgi:membrane peptidoglycan carboxypeptidase
MQNDDRRRAPRWLRRLSRASAVSALGFSVVAGWAYFGSLPDYVSSPNPPTDVLVLVDRSGRPIDPVSARVLRNASAVNPSLGGRVPPLSLRAAKLAAATIAAEDERFANHPGVDVVAIGRAGLADIRARSMVEGGSTITQQLVKLRMGRTGKSAGLSAKAKEAVYAVRLDRVLGKVDIMSAFLREAPYGGRIVGADDAARSYLKRRSHSCHGRRRRISRHSRNARPGSIRNETRRLPWVDRNGFLVDFTMPGRFLSVNTNLPFVNPWKCSCKRLRSRLRHTSSR